MLHAFLVFFYFSPHKILDFRRVHLNCRVQPHKGGGAEEKRGERATKKRAAKKKSTFVFVCEWLLYQCLRADK